MAMMTARKADKQHSGKSSVSNAAATAIGPGNSAESRFKQNSVHAIVARGLAQDGSEPVGHKANP
jgi:hypothetical protein